MPRRLPSAVGSLFVLAALLRASRASACPVCGQSSPGTQDAMLVMTGIMSALPLLIAGGIIGWAVMRARAAARAPTGESTHDPVGPEAVDESNDVTPPRA